MLKALLKSIVGRLSPTFSPVPDKMASSASVHTPTIADHLQRQRRPRIDQSARDRMAIEGFNAWHARAGTGIVAEPIGASPNPIDAATAAASFVLWVAEHQLASEMKVDDLWALAAEDWGPACNWILPPRRVFLGALQRVPGVKVAYDRRIYGRDGKVLRKTTIYNVASGPAPGASALPTCADKSTGVGAAADSETVTGSTMPSAVHEACPAPSWIEAAARHPRQSLACEFPTTPPRRQQRSVG